MDFEQLLCCPHCKGALSATECSSCGRPFERFESQLRFVNVTVDTLDATFQAETQNNSSLMGRIFNVGKSLLSSEYQPTNNLNEFLKCADGIGVDLGSGGRRLRPDIITVDLFPSINVDIVADIIETPFNDAVADYVILDSVIEHVPDPVAVVAEARRILRPGGRIFVNCPFMLPYHGYPAHYQNFTRDGLLHLLRTFHNVEVRPTFGPMTAWVNMTAETFAVMLAGERGMAYLAAKAVALLPIFWLKYLDSFFVKFARSHRVSGLLCATGTR